jgi:hypothetical protein
MVINRKSGWIIQVGNQWVGDHNLLVDSKDESHRWHYKTEADPQADIWRLQQLLPVIVDTYR